MITPGTQPTSTLTSGAITSPAVVFKWTDDKLPVHQAITRIIGALPAIQKTDRGDGVPYRFRGIETLVGHLSGLLAKHGVVIVPSTTLIDVTVPSNTKGPMVGWTETTIAVDWTIYGPAGDHIAARTMGLGRDNSDKGINKAQTQAYKYLLMELFAIGDKEDDGDGIPHADVVASAGGGCTPSPADGARGPGDQRGAPSPPVPVASTTVEPPAASSTGTPDDAAGAAHGPEVMQRMHRLLQGTINGRKGTQAQWQVAVVRYIRTHLPDRTNVISDLPTMVGDNEVWAALVTAFELGGAA